MPLSPASSSASWASQKEVAAILQISQRAVRGIEGRDFNKPSRHPNLRQFGVDYSTGELLDDPNLEEQATELTPVEIARLFNLALTDEEKWALEKLRAWIGWPFRLPPAFSAGSEKHRSPTVRVSTYNE